MPAPLLSDSDGRLIQVFFDGGCFPNPGRKYGSFEVLAGDRTLVRRIRFDLGLGTNNEAEFEALEAALAATIIFLRGTPVNVWDYWLVIFTDSMIVKNRMMGKNVIHKKKSWAGSSERMFNLAKRCLDLADQFGSFRVEWRSREMNVARFGH